METTKESSEESNVVTKSIKKEPKSTGGGELPNVQEEVKRGSDSSGEDNKLPPLISPTPGSRDGRRQSSSDTNSEEISSEEFEKVVTLGSSNGVPAAAADKVHLG